MWFSADKSDRQTVKDILNGERGAARRLYDNYSRYLMALCSRYIPDRSEAEDVLQEAFVKIFGSLGKFTWKGAGSLRAWMSRITANEALQYLRRQGKVSFLEYTDKLPDAQEEIEPDMASIPNNVIMKAIQELPDGYRTVFNLVVFENLSHKEIAAMLGISESTSASQFHRARKMLASKLSKFHLT